MAQLQVSYPAMAPSNSMNAPLTLYIDSNYVSPYAMWAFVALREKRLSFAVQPVDLAARQHHDAAFGNRFLTGKVPALVHGEFALAESSAIIEYLEDVFPAPAHPPLYPADAQQRARARQIQAWLRSDLMALREERPTTVIFREPSPKPAMSSVGRSRKGVTAPTAWIRPRKRPIHCRVSGRSSSGARPPRRGKTAKRNPSAACRVLPPASARGATTGISRACSSSVKACSSRMAASLQRPGR